MLSERLQSQSPPPRRWFLPTYEARLARVNAILKSTSTGDRTHSVYAVYFSDVRIKVGITANVPKRMSYYAQEARRNRVDHLTWWSCAPVTHCMALRMETHFCRQVREFAMPKHREWFEGDASDFSAILVALEDFRVALADGHEVAADLPFQGRHGHIATGLNA
jgi:hypothetical protein